MDTRVVTLSRETLLQELLLRVSRLRGYVRRKIPNRLSSTVSADDILQDVWIAAFRNVSSFAPDGPDAVDRWLMTIANSRIIDAVRDARRSKRGGDRRRMRETQRRFSSLTDLFARIQSPTKTPSSEFGVAESRHAVSIALNLLRQDRRRAVYMHHIEQRSYKEIAQVMGKTEEAVNSLVYNGLLDLRLVLGDAAKYFSDACSSDADATEGAVIP
jgi:RNA polymerase sigma-70 factor (ECF subfamily)